MPSPTLSQKLWMLIRTPRGFFGGIKKEKGIGGAFTLYALTGLVWLILFTIIQVSLPNPLSFLTPLPIEINPLQVAVTNVVYYILALVFLFISSGIVQLFAPRLGGKKGFDRTFKALAYASIPSSLFGWLLYVHFFALIIIGVIVGIWSLALYIIGMAKLHEVSYGRAFLLLLVPFLVVFAIVAIIGFAFLFAFILPNMPLFSNAPLPLAGLN